MDWGILFAVYIAGELGSAFLLISSNFLYSV